MLPSSFFSSSSSLTCHAAYYTAVLSFFPCLINPAQYTTYSTLHPPSWTFRMIEYTSQSQFSCCCVCRVKWWWRCWYVFWYDDIFALRSQTQIILAYLKLPQPNFIFHSWKKSFIIWKFTRWNENVHHHHQSCHKIPGSLFHKILLAKVCTMHTVTIWSKSNHREIFFWPHHFYFTFPHISPFTTEWGVKNKNIYIIVNVNILWNLVGWRPSIVQHQRKK